MILLLITTNLFAQDSLNIKQLFNWNDTSLTQINSYGALFRYNEIWGVVVKGREYAIIGSTEGTHIFDVTDPVNSVQVAFVPGAFGAAIHRDYHDYKGYLYMVCEEGNSTLQIADLRYLPDSVSIVYDSDILINRTHNIFIDSLSGTLYTTSGGVYSLADPTNPQNTGFNGIRGHDLFVRNDTLYVNEGNSGLFIYDYTNPATPVPLGFLSSYPDSGYNHAGWVNEAGNIYAFSDETFGKDVKICDISDLSNIQVLSQVNSGGDSAAMPHNLMIQDDLLYVSYYQDGLYVYDISDPSNPTLAGYYDTYLLPNAPNYNGAWGVFPFLPSGIVLVSDTENGLFVFDVDDIITVTGIETIEGVDFRVFPNPFKNEFKVSYNSEVNEDVKIVLYDLQGKRMRQIRKTKNQNTNGNNAQLSINCDGLPPGIYVLKMNVGSKTITKKLLKLE